MLNGEIDDVHRTETYCIQCNKGESNSTLLHFSIIYSFIDFNLLFSVGCHIFVETFYHSLKRKNLQDYSYLHRVEFQKPLLNLQQKRI